MGQFIAEMRKRKNMTQKELADKVGISNVAVSYWENGKSYPDIELFNAIAVSLDIQVTDLLNCKLSEETRGTEGIPANDWKIIMNFFAKKILIRNVCIAIMGCLAIIAIAGISIFYYIQEPNFQIVNVVIDENAEQGNTGYVHVLYKGRDSQLIISGYEEFIRNAWSENRFNIGDCTQIIVYLYSRYDSVLDYAIIGELCLFMSE